jgi:uncharacterized membrane protein YjjB (DUF3815 family)
VLLAGASAGAGWLVYLLSHERGLGAAGSSALAALTVGFAAQFVAARWRVTPVAVVTAGIVPLLPGLAVYRGLFQLVESAPGQTLTPGLSTLLSAAAVGFALAAGSSLGSFLGKPLRELLAPSRQ